MAKKRAKKATRRVSKAKASRARRRVRLPKSLTARQILAAADAHQLEVESRYERRQLDVSRKPAEFEPSVEVQAFLDELYREPDLLLPDGSSARADIVRAWRILQALRDTYRQGCRQGYIEGYLHRRQVDIKRSRAGNDGKRQAAVTVRGEIMSRDERDERMAAEYVTLCEIMKPTAACMELASRYGFESWQGVRKALKKRADRGLQ